MPPSSAIVTNGTSQTWIELSSGSVARREGFEPDCKPPARLEGSLGDPSHRLLDPLSRAGPMIRTPVRRMCAYTKSKASGRSA